MSFTSSGNGGRSSPQTKNNGLQNLKANGVNLDKGDLVKLLGILEGELQAREIVIAVLKTEQIKHLIYPVGPQLAKPGPRNPLTQLWRDAFNAHEHHNQRIDADSVNNLQQIQAKLLENMISQNNELLSKIKERCCANCQCGVIRNTISLEALFTKEAKEEAERVLEKEMKASLVLEQERDRQKQIVLLLLNERQRLLQELETARTNCQSLLQALRKEKLRSSEIVDGLEEESKRSLFMEEQVETASKQFSAHRLQCQSEIATLREENSRQAAEIEKLRAEVGKLSVASGAVRSQVVSSQSPAPSKMVPVVSPAQLAQRNVAEAPQVNKTAPGRPADRPVPPPVPPNKPIILRKPAHLTSGTSAAAASAGGTVAAAAAPPQATTTSATPVAQAPNLTQDPLDTEIKNFQSVLVAMKAGSPGPPGPPSQPAQRTPP